MKPSIFERNALLAVQPTALSAYVRNLGWAINEEYGDHSDIYVADDKPEIILPRNQILGDYASVVAQVLEILAEVTGTSVIAVYRDIVTSDRDVVRVRTPSDDGTGSIAVNHGIDLLHGARDMILAAACSLDSPRPLYRAGSNREATDYLSRVSLGQTERGSYIITLLSPTIIRPIQPTYLSEDLVDPDPIERRITRRLAEALAATRQATERTVAGEDGAFSRAVSNGVSANLCDALVQLIEPFHEFDVSFAWARTYPRQTSGKPVRFAAGDAPVLRAAAKAFRDRAPRMDVRLFGMVWRLTRDREETEGTITMRADLDDGVQSVTAVLNQGDYLHAIRAHEKQSGIILEGDLERFGQRWRLSNPRVARVIDSSVEAEDTN